MIELRFSIRADWFFRLFYRFTRCCLVGASNLEKNCPLTLITSYLFGAGLSSRLFYPTQLKWQPLELSHVSLPEPSGAHLSTPCPGALSPPQNSLLQPIPLSDSARLFPLVRISPSLPRNISRNSAPSYRLTRLLSQPSTVLRVPMNCKRLTTTGWTSTMAKVPLLSNLKLQRRSVRSWSTAMTRVWPLFLKVVILVLLVGATLSSGPLYSADKPVNNRWL